MKTKARCRWCGSGSRHADDCRRPLPKARDGLVEEDRLTLGDVAAIRRQAVSGTTLQEIARQRGLELETVVLIVSKQQWWVER